MTVPLFNDSPEWRRYVETLEPLVRKIAQKYASSSGDAMRQDCEQEARLALCTIRPETIKGDVETFCATVIRNSVLSYLDSFATGPWELSRVRKKRDGNGAYVSYRMPARFSSLDMLESQGMQVDEFGAVSWDNPSDDGLVNDEAASRREYAETVRTLLKEETGLPETTTTEAPQAPEPIEVEPMITNPAPEPITEVPLEDRRRMKKPLQHGTRSGFRKGCRCNGCVLASREYSRQKRAKARTTPVKKAPAVKAPVVIEAPATITEAPTVRAGLAILLAALKAQLLSLLTLVRRKPKANRGTEPAHGTAERYRLAKWKCRCDKCRAAHAAKSRAEKAKRKTAA